MIGFGRPNVNVADLAGGGLYGRRSGVVSGSVTSGAIFSPRPTPALGIVVGRLNQTSVQATITTARSTPRAVFDRTGDNLEGKHDVTDAKSEEGLVVPVKDFRR